MGHRKFFLVVRLHQGSGQELARTVRIGTGPHAARSPTVDASPGVNRRLERRHGPRSRLNSPRLRTARLCSVRVVIFKPSRLSIGTRGRKKARDPARLIGTKPPGRWDNADRSPAPAPQSKPVTPASRLVAQETPLVASGLGSRILAAGPATYRQYSYRQRCVRQSQIHARLA